MFLLRLAACAGGLERAGDDTGLVYTTPTGDPLPPEGTPVVSAYLAGRFATLPAYAATSSVYGSVLVTRKLDGTASLTLGASGLAQGVEHTAHVHTWPCAYEGGTHYLLDPSTPDAGEPNEIWVTFTPDADGNAVGAAEIGAPLRGDALSVVIHDPATGSKLACADLAPEQLVGAKATGTFAPFALYEAVDADIAGTAEVVMSNSSTVTLDLTGLVPTETYDAHVHVFPCELLDAGGHYKLDPSVVDALETNEIWPLVVVAPDGTSHASITVSGHTVREDAAAVVVHRVAGAELPKVACANLTREAYLPLATYGHFTSVGGASVGGAATLTRRFDGATVLAIEATALQPGAKVQADLTTLPCGVQYGGPAYAEGAEGLAVSLTADGSGAATGSAGVTWTARAEGQSVVLTGADGVAVGCADLE